MSYSSIWIIFGFACISIGCLGIYQTQISLTFLHHYLKNLKLFIFLQHSYTPFGLGFLLDRTKRSSYDFCIILITKHSYHFYWTWSAVRGFLKSPAKFRISREVFIVNVTAVISFPQNMSQCAIFLYPLPLSCKYNIYWDAGNIKWRRSMP